MTKLTKKAMILLIVLSVTWTYSNYITHRNSVDPNTNSLNQELDKLVIDRNDKPQTSSPVNNYDILNEIITEQLFNYNTLGYFSQPYQPSLQATYYALYILNVIDQIDYVNTTSILNFILFHYDDQKGIFEDEYSKRYLDTEFSVIYYPLTTVLEVNCYAILSLDILGQLKSINKQHFIDFIWSCYDPENSYNGFIGQPYRSDLDERFKIATMDNTYFAVNTLNLLLDDWSLYKTQKARIIQFIDNLQSTSYYAGFSNDLDAGLNSLYINDPNLLSSYYCLKTLQIFGMLDAIRTTDFHQFLDATYYNNEYYFDVYPYPLIPNATNVMATAIGLELSDITGFGELNREGVIDFILQQRANNGGWYTSSSHGNYELIDAYHVIRSISGSGELSRLSVTDKNSIANFLNLFVQYNGGYSLISKEYMSIDLIHSIISSFEMYDRVPDLAIQELYTRLCDAYRDLGANYRFLAYCPVDPYSSFLHSFPIEYHCIGTSQSSHLFNMPITHKETFKALDSMEKTYKLNDFAYLYDLNGFIQNVIDSQLLDTNSKNYGGFLPYKEVHPTFQDILIRFEYSYYSLKILELINDYLDLGTLTDLPFNKGALFSFISKHIAETDTSIYFNWSSQCEPEEVLESTYYMIYILKALNLYDLNSEKIKNYVLEHLHYNNSKILYYSYKISDILNLDINFNLDLSIALVKALYLDELYEFYLDTSLSLINPETFLWFSEIARQDELQITCSYVPIINLGSTTKISTTFRNLVLDDFGPYSAVKFESEQLGTFNFEEQSANYFELNLLIPAHPDIFPQITGQLKIYDGLRIIGGTPLILQTTFNQTIDYNITENSNQIYFEVNITRNFSYESQPLSNSSVQLDVVQNGCILESVTLNHEDYTDHSYFYLGYTFQQDQHYHFKVLLVDDYYPKGLSLFDHEIEPDVTTPSKDPEDFILTGPMLAFSALGFGLILTSLTVFVSHLVKRKKYRNKNPKYDKTKKPKKKDLIEIELEDELGQRMKRAFFNTNN